MAEETKIDLSEPFHWVEDVRKALRIAKALRDMGKFDMFRGQIRNFPVCPSVFRQGVDRASAVSRLDRFSAWINGTPELASLHWNPDAILAVAQHYGIPTPMLDFSFEPDVAAFFAADGALPPVKVEEHSPSCIICVNRRQFEESWKDINARARKTENLDLVRVVEVHVQNLWRLQAQKGSFILARVDSTLLEMFSGFFRILFPYGGPLTSVARCTIYPDHKSHLEVLLAQYFSAENFASSMRDAEQLFDKVIQVGPEIFVGDDASFLNRTFPPEHATWTDGTNDAWLCEPDEYLRAPAQMEGCTVHVDTDATPQAISASVQDWIKARLRGVAGIRQRSIDWEVLNQDGGAVTIEDECSDLSDDEACAQIPCSGIVSQIWEGMRRLPFTDEDVAAAVGNYLAMAVHGGYQAMEVMYGPVLGIELTAGGSRTRAFASVEGLRKCLRSDILDFVVPARRSECADPNECIEVLLSILVVPSRLFAMSEFVSLFARQIIPSQAKIRLEADLILFNPVRVSVFGNS